MSKGSEFQVEPIRPYQLTTTTTTTKSYAYKLNLIACATYPFSLGVVGRLHAGGVTAG